MLCLIKHSKPDITNVTRELSKMNDGANQAAFFEMQHVIMYMLDTRNFGLKLIYQEMKTNFGKLYV